MTTDAKHSPLLPTDLYSILRDFAHVSDLSMNGVVVVALRRFFTEDGTEKTVDALLVERRAGLRRGIGRLRQEDSR